MFWPDIFPSLRETKRRSNLNVGVVISIHPKERYIWVQVRIPQETYKAVLVDNGVKQYIAHRRAIY